MNQQSHENLEADATDLLKRAKAGNKEAFVTLIQDCEPLLWGIIRNFSRNHSLEADDIFSEVMLRAYAIHPLMMLMPARKAGDIKQSTSFCQLILTLNQTMWTESGSNDIWHSEIAAVWRSNTWSRRCGKLQGYVLRGIRSPVFRGCPHPSDNISLSFRKSAGRAGFFYVF